MSPNVRALQSATRGDTIEATIGPGSSSAKEVWDIEDGGLRDFAADVIGWSRKKKGTTRIERFLPAQHPDLPYCWASGINSVQGLATVGKRAGKATGTDVAAFKVNRVIVNYETPMYDIIPDEDVELGEWQRFLTLTDVTSVDEFYRRKLGVFQYNSDDTIPGNLQGTRIPDAGSTAQLIHKLRYTYLWISVPDDGLYTNGGFRFGGRAKNIEDCIGRVNKEDFFGWPPGTVLFEGWKPIARTPPVDPKLLHVVTKFPRTWDVQLIFLFFDPEPGNQEKRGHNLVPHPTESTWWRAHMVAAGAGDEEQYWRYRECDMYKIFEMIN